MISIGITGIIGSGKSMLSNVFRAMNIPVYDADSNAKLLMNSCQNIQKQMIEYFGSEVYVNNQLNKDFLRDRIFKNEADRLKINSIVHPEVKNDFIVWRQNLGSDIVAIESAILFEANIQDVLNSVIFVDAEEDTIINRICRRDGVTAEVAKNKVALQRKNAGKERCEYVFYNDRYHSLIEQANDLLNEIRK